MSTMRHSSIRLGKSQEGVVSLLVTMVLMIVVSLIALGFAQLARRNQGQQLNEQLSTQAFCAAESGINDAAQIFSTQIAADVSATSLSRATCNAPGPGNAYLPLNNGSLIPPPNPYNIAYTCVLINPAPGDIKTNIGTTSKIIPINSSTAITAINLSWSTLGASATPANGCKATVQLPTAVGWGTCGMGVLRVDLVPTDSAAPAPTNATTFAKQTLTFFVVPITTGIPTPIITYNGANASTNNNDNIVGAHCKNLNPNCQATINTSGFPYKSYTMRVSSEYEDSALDIKVNGGAAQLTGAQVVIDATGKAQNVVRRIQAYVPIGILDNKLSDYAIESTDSICKRYVVMNGYYASEMGAIGVTSNNPNVTINPLCQ